MVGRFLITMFPAALPRVWKIPLILHLVSMTVGSGVRGLKSAYWAGLTTTDVL